MDETREQYLERIINGSTAYINVKERREEKTTEQIINDYVGVLNQILEILNMETLEDEELHYVKHSLRKRFEGYLEFRKGEVIMARELYGPLFSVKKAANYLGIGITRTYKLVNTNILKSIKDKNGSLIAKSVLDDYIEEQYQKNASS